MNKYKIAIKKSDNASYSLISDSNSIDYANSTIIKLDENDLLGILEGKEIEIHAAVGELKDNIILEFDNRLFKVLAKKWNITNVGEDFEVFEFMFNNKLEQVSKVIVANNDGHPTIKFEFVKEMVVNGNNSSSSNKKSANVDIITEIDMSKFNPREVIKKIKEKVIGQDKTVETILNNIYNNQRILATGDEDLLESKVNILLDGPTGTGKTFIIKQVSKNLSIPINIVPADSFAASGYKGAQLEEMLIPLLDQTGGNVELAERGIVVLDEFDKLCSKGDNSLEMRKAVQQALLTYIGGTKISFEYQGKRIQFDTSKVTFVCLGAFTELRERKIKEERDENGNYTIYPEDYIEEGMIRELIGRFSLLTSTRALGKDDFIKILKESKTSPLLMLKKLAKILYGKDLIVEEELIEQIAAEAVETKTGARALQTIIFGIREEGILDELINDVEKKEIYLTVDLLEKYKQTFVRSVA